MTWQTPWVISGVTEVPLDVARVMAYAATGGAEGVIGAADLEVRQLATAGGSIRVLGGAFVALNRYASGSSQSYIGYNVGEATVAVSPNTGSTTRYDLVYAHITDPGQSGGGSTAAPVETRIIQSGVTVNTTQLNQVAGYANTAGYALARLAIPANTSAITQAMITDLRGVAQARRQTEVLVTNLTGATSNQASGTWNLFPNQATWDVTIPSWATRMSVVAQVQGIEITGTSGQGFAGKFRVKAASQLSPETEFNLAITSGTKDTAGTLVAGDLPVTKATRGTSQVFRLEAIKSSGAAELKANAGTVIVLQVTFYVATESTTAA